MTSTPGIQRPILQRNNHQLQVSLFRLSFKSCRKEIQSRTQSSKDQSFKQTCRKVYLLFYFFFKKMDHSRSLFRLFYKQLTVNKCSIKVADDWIRTGVLWYWKHPLCQLRHNHCPKSLPIFDALIYVRFQVWLDLYKVLRNKKAEC